MTDILIPCYPSASYGDWVAIEVLLPNGYQMVACVVRPDGTTYDLGMNSEGQYRMFRRGCGEFENSHYAHGEPLSDVDLAGFGLSRAQCPYLPGDFEAEGDYADVVSPVVKTLLKGV
jgi:hypothetical protein